MQVEQIDREAANDFAGLALLSVTHQDALEIAFAAHRQTERERVVKEMVADMRDRSIHGDHLANHIEAKWGKL